MMCGVGHADREESGREMRYNSGGTSSLNILLRTFALVRIRVLFQ